MLHHVRSSLHHAACVAARTHPAPNARIRYQKVLAALLTARPRKPVRQNGKARHLKNRLAAGYMERSIYAPSSINERTAKKYCGLLDFHRLHTLLLKCLYARDLCFYSQYFSLKFFLPWLMLLQVIILPPFGSRVHTNQPIGTALLVVRPDVTHLGIDVTQLQFQGVPRSF